MDENQSRLPDQKSEFSEVMMDLRRNKKVNKKAYQKPDHAGKNQVN